jgi:aspartate 1-decarboxylase
MWARQSPGACPICGAAHTSCTAGDRVIVAVQLPARDAAVELARPPLVAEVGMSALGDGTDGRPFSTATYRGKRKR